MEMISEEDKKRCLESRNCHDCIRWHHNCNAECCKMIFMNGIPIKALLTPFAYLDLRQAVNSDMQHYFALRGVKYVHGILKFPKEHCTVIGNQVVYVWKCAWLTKDNLCKGHPNGKPLICQSLTAETAKDIKRVKVTANCLFKYKIMDRENNE
jgi:hypothetical protein